MPWAAGTFTRIFGATGWVDDRVAGTFVLASRHDTHDQDLAMGINFCLNKDNSTKPTASFLPASNGAYDLGSAAARWRNVYGNIFPDMSAQEIAFGLTSADIDALYPQGHARRYRLLGDGTNETTKFTNWLGACSGAPYQAYLPKASVTKYVVAAVTVPTNIHIVMDQGAIVEAPNTLGVNDRLLNITNDNVTIDAYGAIVRMVRSDYPSGEQRHGVYIFGAQNVRINGLESSDTGGDGFYVGGGLGDPAVNVVLQNCKGNNNRRQGLTVVQCRRFRDIDGQWTGSNGQAPAAGIDIEPNNATDILEDIKVIRPRCTDNDGPGIEVFLANWNSTSNYADIDIIEPYTANNGAVSQSGRLRPGIDINRIPSTTPCRGRIRVVDAMCVSEKNAAIHVYDWDVNGPWVDIVRPTVINPNSANGAVSTINGGIILHNSGTFTSTPGNIRIFEPVIRDDSGLLNSNTLGIIRVSGAWTNSDIAEPRFTFAGTTPWVIDATASVRVFSERPIFSHNTGNVTMTDGRYLGRTFTNNGAAGGINYSLIQATSARVGWRIAVEVWAAQTLAIIPNAADKIVPIGDGAAAGAAIKSSVIGSRMVLECRQAGFWHVVEQSLVWAIDPAAGTPPTYTITNPVVRRAFDTATVTLPQLAQAVGSIATDFKDRGYLR